MIRRCARARASSHRGRRRCVHVARALVYLSGPARALTNGACSERTMYLPGRSAGPRAAQIQREHRRPTAPAARAGAPRRRTDMVDRGTSPSGVRYDDHRFWPDHQVDVPFAPRTSSARHLQHRYAESAAPAMVDIRPPKENSMRWPVVSSRRRATNRASSPRCSTLHPTAAADASKFTAQLLADLGVSGHNRSRPRRCPTQPVRCGFSEAI